MPRQEPSTNLPTLHELRGLLAGGGGTLTPGTALHAVMKHPLAFVAGEAQALVTVRHDGIKRILAAHTSFNSRPLERVRRTRELMDRIKFGTHHEAEWASRRLWDIHDRLRVRAADGRIVRSTEPELLAVLMVMGQLCSATWNTLMTTAVTRRSLQQRADALFARMWTDYAPSRASVGIPAGYLPADPDAAIRWVMDTLERRWNNGIEAQALASGVMALPQSYVNAKFSAPWAQLLTVPAAMVANAAMATAVLSMRGAVAARASEIASPRRITAGLAAAQAIRLALAPLPAAWIHRLVDNPASTPCPRT